MSVFKGKFKKFFSLLMVSLMVLPFGVTVLSACGDDNNGGSTEKPVDPPPPPPEEEHERYVTVNNIRVGLLSDTVVRVEYRGAKGFEDRDTFYISNRDEKKAPAHTLSTEGSNTVISTSEYKVYVPNNASGLAGVHIESAAGEQLWQYEGDTTNNVYLPSPSDELTSWQLNDTPRIVPSDYGYSVNKDNNDPLQGWDFSNDASDCYVFLPNGDYKQFCEDYIQLTGKSEMISLQMLGYWDSRWFAYSDETAMKQIDDYISKGYSIDILVIDKDWHANNGMDGVGYEVDTDLFPNMSQFLADCHEKGINIMFNDHPEPVRGTGNLLDGEEVKYRNESLTMILSLGLDYWWYDRNWGVALKQVDPDISLFATGMYAFQFVTDEYLHTQIDDLNEYAERALIMGNVDGCLHGRWTYASDASAHKYSIQWTGDIGTSKAALEQEIYASVFGGAEVGLPYMSSDIGGHTAAVSDDMYVRWLQYGALSTICRVHCTAVWNIGQDGRMPWLFGETAEKVAHEYVDMRYRLLPLYYALARENYDTGLPVMRRTDVEYPEYMEASRNDQYLLGKNMLVAPIAEGEQHDVVPAEWLTAANGTHGLDATYYSDRDLGSARRTQIDPTVNFEWGNGGPQGLGADNFSIRWTGKITIGEKDSQLAFFADDGIRVWIDGVRVIDGWAVYDKMLRTEEYYAAGSTHDIRIEYFEAGGGAHAFMYYIERLEGSAYKPNTRTVFIPDGTWIDVWSGQRYVGPQTITVSHGLETSPVFVREGGVFALAENMVNTSAKDWSNMALDIYAGKENTETTLYEDDTKTQAYKDGKYRKTLITNEFENGKFTVTVNPAEGEFTGDRAFSERNWNVRIHARPEWGNIKSIRVNGKAITSGIRSYKKSTTASPFAFSGAALDGNVWEFELKAGVYEKTTVTFEFSGTLTDLEKPEYDDNAAEFDVKTEETGSVLDLTAAGDVDWAYFAAGSSNMETVRKDTAESYIGNISSYATNSVGAFSGIYTSWSDGAGGYEKGSVITTELSSQKDFALTFKTDATKRYYVINLGGQNCIAKLTVRDRAGNVKTIKFGSLRGDFRYRAVISAKSEVDTEISVTYSVLVSRNDGGTGSPSYVNVSSAYVSTTLPEQQSGSSVNVNAEINIGGNPPSANLSTTTLAGLRVADWRHFDSTIGAGEYTSMVGGNTISNVVFTSSQDFSDYSTSISWNDGTPTASSGGTTHGLCSPSGTITVMLNVTAKTRKVLLYVGAWNGSNTVTVLNGANERIAVAPPFSGGSTAATRLVEVDIDAEDDTILIIRFQSTPSASGGNVSIAALQVLEEA